MTPRYAFYFDSSACTGCKACQIACKDKNDLPVGVLWRRVVEVAGGSWFQAGDAWRTTARAYHVSLACNHCEAPICAEVCPTRAMTQRPDGVVYVDPQLCMGCRYCEMACPYKAPQFDPAQGVMTKCNFCMDLLDVGQPPACVAACQMRVLHFGELEDLRARFGDLAAVYPLPEPNLTQPALVLTAHLEALPPEDGLAVGNWEEI